MKKLGERDRKFLGCVARAAFINPFSELRPKLHSQMVELSGRDTGLRPEGDPVERSFEVIRHHVEDLRRSGNDHIGHYRGIDRPLVRTAILFDLFHRFTGDFDRLILEQIEAGDKSCPVPFAGRITGHMEKSGFSHEEALRYLGFFFQLRRAYFFIRRSLVGESPSMRKLRFDLWDSVFTSDIRWYERFLWSRMEDFSTLLLGETGTGKGTAAAAIGRSIFIPFDEKTGCYAESFTRNFISINLSGFPETLIESELFGHKKGAFTGATDHYKGVFARCSPHGAIFLDEIGDVSAHVQLKLLQVLQERTFSPVGGHERIQFPSRVIAATNKHLDELRRSGQMRDDFYYRLCSNTITVPPLRMRIRESAGELDLLLDHVIHRMLGKRSPDMVRTARRILNETVGPDYSWAGNVRELEQAVRRIIITRGYKGEAVREASSLKSCLLRAIDREEISVREILLAYCSLLYERYGTYEEVARITGLDRRTVKKHLAAAADQRSTK